MATTIISSTIQKPITPFTSTLLVVNNYFTTRKFILQTRQTQQRVNLPPQYYLQCIHALFVTGADYIELSALIYLAFSKTPTAAQLMEYRIERKDVMKDIEYLILEECKFWGQVENDEEPFLKIY